MPKIIANGFYGNFSIKGETNDFDGRLRQTIIADNVYSNGLKTANYSFNVTEARLIGEPTDLTITHFLRNHPDINKIDGNFWITYNPLLQPDAIVESSYTGEVKVEVVRQIEFSADAELKFNFQKHFKKYKNENDDTSSFSELVANFSLDGENNESARILESLRKLDDLLLLSSFAARYRSVCVGWDLYDSKTLVKKFLRDKTIPDNSDKAWSRYDSLIDLSNFEEFIATVYSNFQNYIDIEAFRRTMNFVIPDSKNTIDGSFIILYSALEMIVLHFRRKNGLEFILPNKKFEKVRKKIKDYIEHLELLEDESEKIKIKEKLSELNRISFATAFEEFCKHYSVDISDLWSVTGNNTGISLSQIRNKLIHGEHFSAEHYTILFYAREHLRWTVERMILAILGWTVEKSTVSPQHLKMMTAYKNWQEEQAKFSK
ncbi:MAG TPA: hypothetical protein VNI84_05485 [Pyrinomonadaceae bacterium]|nr:hypothetical protein [Pyrinomonadaceae bacterium]